MIQSSTMPPLDDRSTMATRVLQDLAQKVERVNETVNSANYLYLHELDCNGEASYSKIESLAVVKICIYAWKQSQTMNAADFHRISLVANPLKCLIKPFLRIVTVPDNLLQEGALARITDLLSAAISPDSSPIAYTVAGGIVYWNTRITIHAWYILLKFKLGWPDIKYENLHIPLPGHEDFRSLQNIILFEFIDSCRENGTSYVELPIKIVSADGNVTFINCDRNEEVWDELELSKFTMNDQITYRMITDLSLDVVGSDPDNYYAKFLHTKPENVVSYVATEEVFRLNFETFEVHMRDFAMPTAPPAAHIINAATSLPRIKRPIFSVHASNLCEFVAQRLKFLENIIVSRLAESTIDLAAAFINRNTLEVAPTLASYLIQSEFNTFDYIFVYVYQQILACADHKDLLNTASNNQFVAHKLYAYLFDNIEDVPPDALKIIDRYMRLDKEAFLGAIENSYIFVMPETLPSFIALHITIHFYKLIPPVSTPHPPVADGAELICDFNAYNLAPEITPVQLKASWSFNVGDVKSFLGSPTRKDNVYYDVRSRFVQEAYFVKIKANAEFIFNGNRFSIFSQLEDPYLKKTFNKVGEFVQFKDVRFNGPMLFYPTVDGNFNALTFSYSLSGPFLLANTVMGSFLDPNAAMDVEKEFFKKLMETSLNDEELLKIYHAAFMIREKRNQKQSVMFIDGCSKSSNRTLQNVNFYQVLEFLEMRSRTLRQTLRTCDETLLVSIMTFLSFNFAKVSSTSMDNLRLLSLMLINSAPMEIAFLLLFIDEVDLATFQTRVRDELIRLKTLAANPFALSHYVSVAPRGRAQPTSEDLIQWLILVAAPAVFNNKPLFVSKFRHVTRLPVSQSMLAASYCDTLIEFVENIAVPRASKTPRPTDLDLPLITGDALNGISRNVVKIVCDYGLWSDKVITIPTTSYYEWLTVFYKRIIFPQNPGFQKAALSKDFPDIITAYLYLKVSLNFHDENFIFLTHFFATIVCHRNYEKLAVVLQGRSNSAKTSLIQTLGDIVTSCLVNKLDLTSKAQILSAGEGPTNVKLVKLSCQVIHYKESDEFDADRFKDVVEVEMVDMARANHSQIQKMYCCYKVMICNNKTISSKSYDEASHVRLMLLYNDHTFDNSSTLQFCGSMYEHMCAKVLPICRNFNKSRIAKTLRIFIGYIYVHFAPQSTGLMLSKLHCGPKLKHNRRVLLMRNSPTDAFEYASGLTSADDSSITSAQLRDRVEACRSTLAKMCVTVAENIRADDILDALMVRYKDDVVQTQEGWGLQNFKFPPPDQIKTKLPDLL